MKVSPRYHTDPRNLELELTLRDMLTGMEEIYSTEALAFADCGMEVLSIEPPGQPVTDTPPPQTARARVVPFRRSA